MSNTNDSMILVDIEDGLAVITLNDPQTLNSISVAMASELTSALRSIGGKARAVVITGAGRGFCAGANLAGSNSASMSGAGHLVESVFNPLAEAFRNLPIPIVAAVNGAAAGAGCSLAMLCDLVVASESAYFLCAFSRVGLVPDLGCTYILPRLIGRARASELMLLAEKISSKQALDWGLVNRRTTDADLMTTALEIGRRLATGPASVGITRRLIWDSIDSTWPDQLRNEVAAIDRNSRTEDSVEGLKAFIEKRPASFRGR